MILVQPWSYKIIHQNVKVVLFHAVKVDRCKSGPFDLAFLSVELWLKFQSLTKIYHGTSEASEFSAQASLLWYIFIVPFCPFWSLTVPVHFHCMEKVSLAPPFFAFHRRK